MTVLADDKSIEKKDKTAGEPVQFYVKGTAHMSPYEIVVFDVGKVRSRATCLHQRTPALAPQRLPLLLPRSPDSSPMGAQHCVAPL